MLLAQEQSGIEVRLWFVVVPHIVLGCLGFVGGCAATNSKNDSAAASITYAMPETSLRIGLDLVLKDCSGKQFLVTPTITTSPVVTTGPERFAIGSKELVSAIQKRDVSIGLYENGTLKTVNAATSDRSLAIIANVLKLATSVIGLTGFNATNVVPECNPKSVAAIQRVKALEDQRDRIREYMLRGGNPERVGRARQAIEAIALEIAETRSNQLRLELKRDIKLVDRKAMQDSNGNTTFSVEWDAAPFEKWVDAEYAAAAAARFKLTAEITVPDTASLKLADEAEPKCKTGSCPFFALREPVAALAKIRPAEPASWPEFSPNAVQLQLPVSQWGQKTYLSLTAPFAQSRTIKFELDPFGRKTSFGFASEASAEAITGGLLAAVDAGGALDKATANQTEHQKRLEKIAELEAQQKYNKLIRCEEIIAAGGYLCPD